MLLNISELQQKAIVNLIHMAVGALGQHGTSALVEVVGNCLEPATDEQLKELGYIKKPEASQE